MFVDVQEVPSIVFADIDDPTADWFTENCRKLWKGFGPTAQQFE